MPYVYSTLTNDVRYVDYHKPVAGSMVREIKEGVLVKGGTNLADKRLHTPLGVVTHVTDEQAAFLERNDAFIRHSKKGFLVLRDDNIDPEKVASEMKTRDGAAPLRPEDFDNEEGANKLAKPAQGTSEGIMQRIAGKFKG